MYVLDCPGHGEPHCAQIFMRKASMLSKLNGRYYLFVRGPPISPDALADLAHSARRSIYTSMVAAIGSHSPLTSTRNTDTFKTARALAAARGRECIR